MLFASWSFLLVFLPACLIAFHLSPRRGEYRRALVLILASGVFYAFAGLASATIMILGVAVNYGFGRVLTALRDRSDPRLSGAMWLAVGFNIALLLAVKLNALVQPLGDGFRVGEDVLVPLGLSYLTFQQIGFLVACRRGEVRDLGVVDYLFFIAFFPHLLMGPLVRYVDMRRQLDAGALGRASSRDLAVGAAIFIYGLAQKVILADQLAPAVDHVFAAAQQGALTPAESAMGLIGFQLQLYFDFVGYADMAIGLARMFGVSMPINFDRPLFARDRFELWRRWHITFAIFMRTHVFQPLVRRRRWPIPAALAATGLLSGLWHGLGPTFVIWGLLQTAILLFEHERRRRRRSGPTPNAIRTVGAIALTFGTSCLIGGLFRAQTLDGAVSIYGGLFDLGAIASTELLGPRAWLLIPLAGLAAWGLPSSAQLFRSCWTAIDPRPDAAPPPPHPLGAFALTPAWALRFGLLLALCLALMGEARRFVYVQF